MRLLKIFVLSLALVVACAVFDSRELFSKNKKNKKHSIHKTTKKHLKKKISQKRESSSYLQHMSLALLKEYCPEYCIMNHYRPMNFVERKSMFTGHINEAVNPYSGSGPTSFSFENVYYPSSIETPANGIEETIFDKIEVKLRLINEINKWLGTPYKYAGRSRKGIDCSNFTSVIISGIIGQRFPAGADVQSKIFEPVRKIEDLQFGDIMFFSSSARSNGRIGHSGIYIGNGLFAHSSSYKKRGVIYQHISDSKYTERFQFGGRFYKSRWAPAT